MWRGRPLAGGLSSAWGLVTGGEAWLTSGPAVKEKNPEFLYSFFTHTKIVLGREK
jgi:hypothetical protein